MTYFGKIPGISSCLVSLLVPLLLQLDDALHGKYKKQFDRNRTQNINTWSGIQSNISCILKMLSFSFGSFSHELLATMHGYS